MSDIIHLVKRAAIAAFAVSVFGIALLHGSDEDERVEDPQPVVFSPGGFNQFARLSNWKLRMDFAIYAIDCRLIRLGMHRSEIEKHMEESVFPERAQFVEEAPREIRLHFVPRSSLDAGKSVDPDNVPHQKVQPWTGWYLGLEFGETGYLDDIWLSQVGGMRDLRALFR